MFESLKKLFSGDTAPARTAKASGSASTPPEPALPDAFLQRDVVFDRRNRLAGHLFSLQFPYEPSHSRRQCDQALIDTLNASSNAWNTGQVFIPIAASSLDLPAIDFLRAANTGLLIDLDSEGDPQALISRFDELHGRGLRLGLFRNPRHPAFAALIAALGYADLVPGTEKLVPKLRIEQVPGCGHFVQAERPDVVNRALLTFLSAPPATAAAAPR